MPYLLFWDLGIFAINFGLAIRNIYLGNWHMLPFNVVGMAIAAWATWLWFKMENDKKRWHDGE